MEKLTIKQLKDGLKYEILLSKKLKKELDRIQEEYTKSQLRISQFNINLINKIHFNK